jgi:hypothetical protein
VSSLTLARGARTDAGSSLLLILLGLVPDEERSPRPAEAADWN